MSKFFEIPNVKDLIQYAVVDFDEYRTETPHRSFDVYVPPQYVEAFRNAAIQAGLEFFHSTMSETDEEYPDDHPQEKDVEGHPFPLLRGRDGSVFGFHVYSQDMHGGKCSRPLNEKLLTYLEKHGFHRATWFGD